MQYILMRYQYNLLSNLSYYKETYIRDYTDGFYITLTRIGKIVFFYGSLIVKTNNIYKSIIPEKFRPKQETQIIWSIADSSSLYPKIVIIEPNGIIKTDTSTNNVVISGMTIWETN